jgi:phospholipase C
MIARALGVSVLGTSLIVWTMSAPMGCGKDAQVNPDPLAANGPDEDEGEPTGDGLGDETTAPPPVPDGTVQTPIPTKIRYVLVLVKENHTFDNYFTGFPGATTVTKAKLSNGTTITRPIAPDTKLSQDICHSNTCGQRAYANGAMNGFDLNKAGNLPFIRYTEQQIPNYWQYARNFVLADHLFSTTLGPSTPGHAVYWTGRSLSIENAKCILPDGGECTKSGGCKANPLTMIKTYDPDQCTTKIVPPCFDVPALPDHLPAGFTWMNYGTPHALMVKSVANAPDYKTHFRKQGDLVADLNAGHIANLTIAHILGGVSEHPDQHPCPGENYSVEVINAAMKLPQWNEMAIVLTWDDSGGFFDHVAPPVKKCANGQVFQSGFRVPTMVISPYAKKGFVLKTPANQASVPRLVEELWGMPFMTARDAHALDGTSGSLMDAFDFAQPARAPMILSTRTCPP